VPAVAASAPWEEQCLRRSTTYEPFTFGIGQTEPERDEDVRDRAVREAPALAAIGGEPGDESLQGLPVDPGHTRVRRAVAEDEGGQQAPAFAPRRLADRVVAETGVPVDPAQRVVPECRPKALGPRLGLASYLERPCLGEARHRLFALAPLASVDGDVATARL
jgi:hypothetical protein